MAQLRVDPPVHSEKETTPFQTLLEVTLHNDSKGLVELHPFLARIPFLVLEVKDPKGGRVGLPPPPPPPPAEKMGEWAMEEIREGESLTLRYQNFLDWDAEPGTYSARFRSTHPLTGGSPNQPLETDWTNFRVTQFPPTAIPSDCSPELTGSGPWIKDGEVWQRLKGIPQSPVGPCPDPWTKEFLQGYFSRADHDPDAPSEWKARFRVEIGEEDPDVLVTVRVRVHLDQAASSLDLDKAWEGWRAEVAETWSNKFEVCIGEGATQQGMPIVVRLCQVTSDCDRDSCNRHEVRVPGALSSPRERPISSLRKWFANDNHGVAHEVGHLLGNRDEYGKYLDDGDYGCPYEKEGGIMNNPLDSPKARHYELIRWAVAEIRGEPCTLSPIQETS